MKILLNWKQSRLRVAQHWFKCRILCTWLLPRPTKQSMREYVMEKSLSSLSDPNPYHNKKELPKIGVRLEWKYVHRLPCLLSFILMGKVYLIERFVILPLFCPSSAQMWCRITNLTAPINFLGSTYPSKISFWQETQISKNRPKVAAC